MMDEDGLHRDNLQKLASYLMYGNGISKGIRFTMASFTKGKQDVAFCETAGCAVGFAPFAGITKLSGEDFMEYSSRTLISATTYEWEWCFSGEWIYVDNTREGAARRIQYLLDGGKVPDDFDVEELSCLYEDQKDELRDVYSTTEVKPICQ